MAINPLTATAADLQVELAKKSVSSRELVKIYLGQIARHDKYLKAVIATTPETLLFERAAKLDDDRANGTIHGPLHGIPILLKVSLACDNSAPASLKITVLKDNIVTGPELGLPTTCGSLALVGSKPRKNAAIVDRVC